MFCRTNYTFCRGYVHSVMYNLFFSTQLLKLSLVNSCTHLMRPTMKQTCVLKSLQTLKTLYVQLNLMSQLFSTSPESKVSII